MKVLEFIQSIFVPSFMGRRKGMNIFIAILIYIIASILLALPMINYFSNDRYDVLDENLNFEYFNYCINDSTKFTDEEKTQYNMVTFDELKALGLIVKKKDYAVGESYEKGKEYVLKSVKPIYVDSNIDHYDTYYIHVVLDFFNKNNDEKETYSVEDTFCKYKRDADGVFRHLFIGFYGAGIIYLNTDNSKDIIEVDYSKKTDIVFSEFSSATDLSHSIIDMLYTLYIYQASRRTFLFVFLFPLVINILFSFILRTSGVLKSTKEYVNIGAICTIPLVLIAMIVGFISMRACYVVFNYYSIFYVFYYFICIILINRRPDVVNKVSKEKGSIEPAK